MRIGSHPSARMARAKRAFLEFRGVAAAVERGKAIAARPSKCWHGIRVYSISCHATYGKGPHIYFVPAGLLWSLITLEAFRCPYHL